MCQRATKEFICFNCSQNLRYYQRLRGHLRFKNINLFFVAPYFSHYKVLLKRFKFNKETYLYKKISYMMLEYYLNIKKDLPDILLSMPIGKIKEKQRGFSQCRLLASGISQITGVAIKEYLLRKDGKQLSLDYGQNRAKLIEGFMYPDKKIKLREKKVLVLDDIYTTGATMRESLRVLKDSGAKEIEYLFFARQESMINLKKWFS